MAELFADQLGTGLNRALAQANTPVPPPELGFSGVVSSFFGGDPTGAYLQGADMRAKQGVQSAQTLNALAEAEKRRQDSMAVARENDARAKAQADPAFAASLDFASQIATGANDLSGWRLGDQELGFRGGVADLATSQPQRLANMEALTGRPVERFYDSGAGMQASQIDPNAAPTVTPVGAAQIANYNEPNSRAAAGGDAGGWSPVTVGGRRMLERVNAATGEYESRFVTDPQMLGRERQMAERVRVAGESMADALQTIAEMPSGASTGVFGVGGTPGKSILASTKDTLRNAVTSDDVQMYTAALAGTNRALAVLESAGLAPSGTVQQSFDSLAWREGDKDESTRLYKLAEMRQTVDNAMETALTNPTITPDMKAQVAGIQRRVAAAIPFSPIDIVLLSRSPGTMTLADILKQKGLAQRSVPGAAPAQGGGWTKQVSPSTGAVRWINKATGETRTEAP